TPVSTVDAPSAKSAGPPESPTHGCDGDAAAVKSSAPTAITLAVPVRLGPESPAFGPVVPKPTAAKPAPTNDASTARESIASGATGAGRSSASSVRSWANVDGSN